MNTFFQLIFTLVLSLFVLVLSVGVVIVHRWLHVPEWLLVSVPSVVILCCFFAARWIVIDLVGPRPRLDKVDLAYLRAVADCAERANGITVRKEIERILGREISIGVQYERANDLVEGGYLRSWEEQGGPERKYRVRRFWALTKKGADLLKEG